jgi:hypothetical protein
MIGGLLLNNALNRIDDVTVTRTFWTASALMLVALGMAVYAVRVLRGHHAIANA